MWNQKDTMDAGRFIMHQGGWDEKSALGRYNPVQNSDFRAGGQYGGRGYSEPGFPGDNGYGRGGYHRDMLMDRDRYEMAPPVFGAWAPPGRSTYEEDSSIARGPPRHANIGYGDGYREGHNYREAGDSYRDSLNFREKEGYREGVQHFRDRDNFGDHDYERGERYHDSQRQGFEGDDNRYKRPPIKSSREGSWDREYAHARYEEDYSSDQERDRKDRGLRKVRRRDRERSKERDESPERGRRRDRFYSHSHSRSRSRSVSRSRSGSRSHGHEHRSRRSRSSSRGYSRDKRERSYEDVYSSYGEKRRAKDERRHRDYTTVTPSATLVVKGLSQRTVEDDIYKALAEWGPLRHVRVIKERSTGTSRGFAFVDFPSVDAARKMMDDVGDSGLVVDGRRLFFEYSSKPTGSGFGGGPQVDLASTNGSVAAGAAIDWMCLVCGCVNFARRTSCFQCNEPRTDDAPPADVSTVMSSASGRKGSEAGPTHVLVVRGLDENVSEEILRYEFSKYAPLKDLRLVRDKFTHISKGFAFVHFHSVEDATKALEASNGTTLDKNGQPLRVAFAKSIYGPGSSSTSNAQASNNLAAAAIEAASFAQQYDAVGWAPKEYNPDEAKGVGGSKGGAPTDANAAPQAGFVWDEASGYYYDAASGFYYDGHRGLYYDGNNGIWYTFNQEIQQYEVYTGQEAGASGNSNAQVTSSDASGNQQVLSTKRPNSRGRIKEATTIRKAVISAPPSVVPEVKLGIAEAAKAAAAAANASVKKDNKSRKPLLTSSKTKISGVSAMWKQNKETLLEQGSSLSRTEEKAKNVAAKATAGSATAVATATVAPVVVATAAVVPKKIQGVIHTRQTVNRGGLAEDMSAKSGVAISGMGMFTVPKKLEGVIHSREDRGSTATTKRPEGVLHTREDSAGVGTVKGIIRSRDGPLYSSQAMGHGIGNPLGGEYRSSESTMSQVRGSLVLAGQTSSSMPADVTLKDVDEAFGGKMRGASSATTGGRRRFTEAPQTGRNLHSAG